MATTKRPAKTAGISDEAVERATGRTWAQWLRVLDAAGAREMAHPEIARLLAARHGVPAWWSQTVTVGYEQARGMRRKHQTTDGYQISVTRTLDASTEVVFAAWADARRRARWLRGKAAVRGARPGKDLLLTWKDGTDVEVRLAARGRSRTQVVVQHRKLGRAADARTMKAWWGEALERLREAAGKLD